MNDNARSNNSNHHFSETQKNFVAIIKIIGVTKMQKTMRWLLVAFILFALTDLALTLTGLYFVGADIELNPIIRLTNPYFAAVAVKVFVIWVAVRFAKKYATQSELSKFMTVCFLVLCAFLQLVVSCTNAYMLSKIDFGVPIAMGNAELVKTDMGFDYVKNGEKVGEMRPIEKNTFAIVLFYSMIALFALYPMAFAIISFWLKRRVDKETMEGG